MRESIRKLWQRQDGLSAVEFALIAPIFLLLVTAAVDIGALVQDKMRIEDAAQSAMTYAMGHGQPLDSAKAKELAQNLERILVSRLGSDVGVTVDVNHGAVRTYAGAKGQDSGNAALAASCYCPTMDASSVKWNDVMACGKPCPGGGGSGKFVFLKISKPHAPIFGGYGLAENGNLHLQTIGRIE